MNSDYEQRLEAAIDRELKSLPDLAAPGSLANRIRAAVEQRSALSWYRQPWQSWPFPLRVASLTILLVGFFSLCLGAWQLERIQGLDLLGQEFRGVFSGVISVCSALAAVLNAFALLVKQLGTGILIALFAGLALAWAAFLGLGTVCVRLALARR